MFREELKQKWYNFTEVTQPLKKWNAREEVVKIQPISWLDTSLGNQAKYHVWSLAEWSLVNESGATAVWLTEDKPTFART